MFAVYGPHSWFWHKAKKQFLDQIWCFIFYNKSKNLTILFIVKYEKITLFGEFLMLLGPIISMFFASSNEETKITKTTKGACSSPISMIQTYCDAVLLKKAGQVQSLWPSPAFSSTSLCRCKLTLTLNFQPSDSKALQAWTLDVSLNHCLNAFLRSWRHLSKKVS